MIQFKSGLLVENGTETSTVVKKNKKKKTGFQFRLSFSINMIFQTFYIFGSS